jgi:3-phosphoshikimate 1-carboxyvinyltransferase
MTCALLSQAGIKNSVSPNRRVYRVEALPADIQHKKQVVNIEPDWSSASYIYAAACLVPGLRIRMQGLSYSQSTQGDRVAKELFAQLGVETQELRSPYRANTRSIAIVGTGKHPDSFEYNFIDCPDLLPAVLVSCAALGMKARLRGIKNLRIKESDRINALKEELEKMGATITQTATEVRLAPARPIRKKTVEEQSTPINPHLVSSPLTPCASIRTHSDHRIAMAFGVLTLIFPDMVIEEPEQVSKSFPDFWKQLDLIRRAATNS